MTYAAVILAHQDVHQVARLASRLDCPAWVHYDAASPAHEHVALRRTGLGVVEDPARIRWGHWSMVEALLKSLRAVRGRPDHVLVLSGQTYPIKPRHAVADRLSEPLSFVQHEPLPYDAWPGDGGLERVRRWWLPQPEWPLRRLPGLRRMPMVPVPLLRRRVPPVRFFGGTQWMVLHRDACDHLLEVPSSDPVMKVMRHAFVPDEMLVQTVLANSHLASRLVNDPLHHTAWTTGEPHPAVLTTADLPELRASSSLFARKFTAEDASLLDAVDRELLG